MSDSLLTKTPQVETKGIRIFAGVVMAGDGHYPQEWLEGWITKEQLEILAASNGLDPVSDNLLYAWLTGKNGNIACWIETDASRAARYSRLQPLRGDCQKYDEALRVEVVSLARATGTRELIVPKGAL